MRKRYSRVICECTQRTAHRPLHNQSSSPQSEAREVLTREVASGSPGTLGREGAPRSLEMPPPSQAGTWEGPGRAVWTRTTRHSCTHACHPRAAHGKVGGTSGLGVHAQLQGPLRPCRLTPVPRPTGPHRAQTGA